MLAYMWGEGAGGSDGKLSLSDVKIATVPFSPDRGLPLHPVWGLGGPQTLSHTHVRFADTLCSQFFSNPECSMY